MPAQYAPFSAGDRVRVTGFLADHNAKVFINDRHTNDLEVCPVIEVIGHPGLPDPELIPSLSNCNYFDKTRNDGGERYQTRFTMLHGVRITAGVWASDKTLTISDESGAGSIYIPPMVNLSGVARPSGKFSVVGIYDQEDGGTGSPVVYHGAYRMLLRNAGDIATTLDVCRDVRDCAIGEQVALARKVVSRAYEGRFFIQDPNRTGGVEVISNRPVTVGDVVGIMGTVTESNGQKALNAKYVVKCRISASPLLVNGKTLAGQTGLDVFGLLVRCVGTVGSSKGGGLYDFTTDDNSVITLNSNGYVTPAAGTLVTVTAVASGNASAPTLMLGNQKDIDVIAQ